MALSAQTWLFIIFGILGVFGEVFFTAGATFLKKRSLRLQGFSFIWMFPIYGLLAFLFEPIANAVAGYSWLLRGLVYMVGIYIIEYITGALLKKITGGHIWQYTGKYNLQGHIQLVHAPVWLLMGLLVERYYDHLVFLSIWLTRPLGAE